MPSTFRHLLSDTRPVKKKETAMKALANSQDASSTIAAPGSPVPFPTVRMRALAQSIDVDGFACITDYVEPEKLGLMQTFVASAMTRSQGRYANFKGAEQMAGSTLDEMAVCPTFTALMHGIYEAGTGRSAPPSGFYQILRCLGGEDMAAHSMHFHYDSYVLTALVPIEIPNSGPRGDLLIIPNARTIRSTYAVNFLDKLWLDNGICQRWLKRKARNRAKTIVRLSLVPGNLYFFWGYRSIHTNEACDPDKVRATALFHYADPHFGSSMKRWLHRA